MPVGNFPGSAKMLGELQGVRLVIAEQDEIEQDEEELAGESFLRIRPYSSDPIPAGGEVSVSRPEVPIWKVMWDHRPHWFKHMQSKGHGDRTVLETIVNVATSMPFIAIGLKSPRTEPAAKIYANSLVGVGVASSLYHVSRGESRKFFRLCDYAMIAAASLTLNAATRKQPSKRLMWTSAILLPVQPMVVSCLHTGMVEATFARRARSDPNLKRAHRWHKVSTVVGGVLFAVDDLYPHIPYLHAAWHVAAALGIATCTKLLDP